MKITDLRARKILNSAGNWTVECSIKIDSGESAIASVPSGISTGTLEKQSSPVNQAILQIEGEIFNKLSTVDNINQEKLDQLLEENQSWGTNSALAVSVAFAKASGFFQRKKGNVRMPKIMFLIFEGERHGNPNLTIQEFMVVTENLQQGIDIYHRVGKELRRKNLLTTIGSEGGFSPEGLTDKAVLELIKTLGIPKIALDIAGNINPPTTESVLEFLEEYPIISVEDPFPENKPGQWQEFLRKAKKIRPDILVVADDLTATDAKRIKDGLENNLFNAVIIKPNQRGTISAALEAVRTAKEKNARVIVSHRGEETNDDWIADFAIAVNADFVKFGAATKGERIAKYNRLLQLTT